MVHKNLALVVSILFSAHVVDDAMGGRPVDDVQNRVIFSEDLQSQPPIHLQTQNAKWTKEGIHLTSGAMLAKVMELGQVGEFHFEVKTPPEEADADRELIFQLMLKSGPRMILVFLQRTEGNDVRRSLQIAVQFTADGKSKMAGLTPVILKEPFDGAWSVRFRYGLLHVIHDDKQVLVGHAPLPYDPLRVVGLGVTNGRCIVTRAGLSIEKPAVIRDSAKFAEASKLQEEVRKVYDQGEKWLKISEKLYPLFLEAAGPDHPATILAHQDLGAALCSVNRKVEGEKVLAAAVLERRQILGADHPYTALTLRSQTDQLRSLQRFDEALASAREVERVMRLHFGPYDRRTIEDSLLVANVLFEMSRFDESEKILQQALQDCRVIIGEGDLLFARLLSRQSGLEAQADPGKAKATLLRSSEIIRQNLPKAATELFDSLCSLAEHHIRCHELADAERCLDEAFPLLEQNHADEPLRRCLALGAKARLRAAQRKQEDARAACREIISLKAKLFGDDSVPVANEWSTLGALEYQRGYYAESLEAYKHAEEIFLRTKVVDPLTLTTYIGGVAEGECRTGDYRVAIAKSQEGLKILNDAGLMNSHQAVYLFNTICWSHLQLGDFSEARSDQEKVIAILKKIQPTPTRQLLSANTRLGLIHANLGDYSKAQTILQAVIEEIGDNSSVEAQEELASAHHNLGLAYSGALRQADAIKEFKAAYEIERKILGEDHPSTLATRNQLAAKTSPKQRLETLTEILKQREQAHGPNHRLTLITKSNVAIHHLNAGDSDLALKLFQEILEAEKGNPNVDTVSLASTKVWLGFAYWSKGDIDAAHRMMDAAFDDEWKRTSSMLDYLSEAEALAASQTLQDAASYGLSVSRHLQNVSDESRYAPFWNSRALTTRELQDRRRTALATVEGKAVWSQLNDLQSRISLAIVKSPSDKSDASPLVAMTEEKERLQRRLGEIALEVEKGDPPAFPSPLDLSAQLPPNVAVVDIVNTFGWEMKSGKIQVTSVYDAFVIRNPSEARKGIRWIPLGSAPEIDQHVFKWRAQLLLPFLQPDTKKATPADWGAPESSSAKFLRSRLWEPLDAAIAGCDTVLIIPSGTLTQMPWGALPGKNEGSYLLEDVAVAHLFYGQQALAELQRQPVTNTRCLIASTLPVPVQVGIRSENGKAPQVVPLLSPEIAQGMAKDTLAILENKQATKERIVQQFPHSKLVHLEAHGYVLPGNPFGVPVSIPNVDELLHSGLRTKNNQTIQERNPLALAGITLDPNGTLSSNDSTKLLSGAEIANGDLSNTDLVVLESCETGLGRIASNGEGAFSVQRAFGLAGARSVIGTLWIVQLSPSRILMQEFYQHLLVDAKPKLQSLRKAQLRMMRDLLVPNKVFRSADKSRVAPYYWAGYTLSGDWQ